MNDHAGIPQTAASWRDLPLAAGGRSLIEASAGTGKTWTISLLYLRLLLERALGPAEIVVATFTDAAAQELRERIRARLLWAERHASAAVSGAAIAEQDEETQWLLERWRSAGNATARSDRNRLRLAQVELDRAPIGTLHSICRRILADFPFECGSTFDLGEPVTPEAINLELSDDLWRRLGQAAGDLSDEDRIWWQAGRTELSRHLRKVLAPGIDVAEIGVDGIDALMQAENAALLSAWLGDGAQFKRKDSKLRSRLIALADFIRAGDLAAAAPVDLAEILAGPLDNQIKAPALAAAARSEALAFARRVAPLLPLIGDALRSRALARYRRELRARCQELLTARALITFDELIERVGRALTFSGSELAERLFKAWPVALIDEFQDTDAQQYAILDRIYRDAGHGARGRLIMIGDPKQAIYRFRGGDIDAYLRARATAADTLTLDTNFRASQALVAGLNAFYARAGERLSCDPEHAIRYQPVNASGRPDRTPYRIGAEVCEQPLQFHYWDAADVPEDAAGRVNAALDACANQIVELLGGAHRIGDYPLQPGDIAVLLPANRHVAQLRGRLRDRGVPCVSSSWSSVFESAWALELQIVLYAALHPREEAAVRAALATRLGGRSFGALRALHDQPERWQQEPARFERLDQIWRTRGVLAVIQQLSADAAARLFGADDGERALTDLRHLGELLQARSEALAGREELLVWLADERHNATLESGDASADERQLRIESDAKRVRLMTLHASKGLEFPVVLLPLMWANKHGGQDTIAVVHDAQTGNRVVAFGADARQRHQQAGQDERHRLLYVALTRAQYACHVYALSPARPLQPRAQKSDADPKRAPLDALIERVLDAPEPPQTMAHVRWAVGPWSWPRADYRPTRAQADGVRDVLREPPTPPFESTYSFSSLIHSAEGPTTLEDAVADERAAETFAAAAIEIDATPAPPVQLELTDTEHRELAWLAPVAGADFGNALHAMFEHRRIGQPMHEQHALVRRCLLEAGVGLRGIALDDLVPHLAARVQACLDTPLLAGATPPLTLAALPTHAMSAEMPFEFALGEVSLRRLRAVCDFVPPVPAATLRGLMSGKIDLVFEHAGRFHVLDYKSNRLGTGTRLADYAAPQLLRAMDASHYRFQALLYTLALERYLRQRLPAYRRSAQLGEAIYMFVRAVGIAPEIAPRAGLWTQRFDDRLLDAVDAVLAGETPLGARA